MDCNYSLTVYLSCHDVLFCQFYKLGLEHLFFIWLATRRRLSWVSKFARSQLRFVGDSWGKFRFLLE